MLNATCYMLLATCYMLHTACYMLLATCYMLHAICYMLHATCYMLHATCYMLLATWFMQNATCYLLHGTCLGGEGFRALIILITHGGVQKSTKVDYVINTYSLDLSKKRRKEFVYLLRMIFNFNIRLSYKTMLDYPRP